MGWQLISETYKNLETKLELICEEGHKCFFSLKELRKGAVCESCKNNFYKQTEFKPIKKKGKRVLSIDQASYISGWSIFDGQELIAYGKYEIEKEKEFDERANLLKNWVREMVIKWEPDLVAIEDIQLQENNNNIMVTTYKTLAHLQGIIMNCLYNLSQEYIIVHSGHWRNYNQVKGRTKVDKKKSMQLIAKKLYDVTITNDEADAIGIGRYAARFLASKAPEIKSFGE